MSWLLKIKDSLKITTGDGETYTPFWINFSRSKEFNTAEFEFVELGGTLVDRRKPKGTRVNLEIHFQGEKHLEEAQKFYTSTDNPKYWTLEHPFYGIMYVQPLSINQDNTVYNISKFTIPIVETIIDDAPKTSISALDAIITTKEKLDEAISAIPETLASEDIIVLEEVKLRAFNFSLPIIKLPKELAALMDAVSKANSAIDNAAASASAAMNAVNQLITAPAKFAANLKARVNSIKGQFNALRNTVANLTGVSGKQSYQSTGASMIASICLAVTTPIEGDFSSSKRVSETLSDINESFRLYLEDLDTLQSPNGSSPDSFIPDFNSISILNELINVTTAYLFITVIGARKERSILCETDTNIILLAHRFYSLDPLDKNIDELIENNELSLDELVQIPKGRKIVYYI